MTVERYLEVGDKRKKIYKDVKEYVELVRHHHGPEAVETVMKKEVVDIVGVDI